MKTDRSFILASLLLAALALPGCQQQSGSDTAAKDAAAANPDAKPGIAISAARLVLPAVKGNPGAAYFTLLNGGDKPATLAGVFIDGAGKTEMHETKDGAMAPLPSLDLAPGAEVRFEPGGKHVMAFDLADTVTAGKTVEMTLTFADGDKISGDLAVEPAGGGGHDAHR